MSRLSVFSRSLRFTLAPRLAAVVLLVSLSSLATVVLSKTIEEMTASVPLVVRGTVHRVETGWDEEHRKLWTWSELVVAETLKGPRLTSVLVKQPGGVVGDFHQEVSGVARFTPGEEVVLFLEPAPDQPGAHVVYAMSAGKVALVNFRGAKLARRDLSGLAFAQPGTPGLVRPVDEQETLGLAEAFLARVRVAVKRGAK